MSCCGGKGGCGTVYSAPSIKEEVEKMKDTVSLMEVSGLFSGSEIMLIEKAIKTYGERNGLD